MVPVLVGVAVAAATDDRVRWAAELGDLLWQAPALQRRTGLRRCLWWLGAGVAAATGVLEWMGCRACGLAGGWLQERTLSIKVVDPLWEAGGGARRVSKVVLVAPWAETIVRHEALL